MPFKIIRNDITKMQVDAIVNTANEEVTYSDGVDYAVYQAAGENELLVAREAIGKMAEGDVAITQGFKLPAKYIIHAVSPFYFDGEQGEAEKLRSCYAKSLELARKNKCKSIAFPLIATGSYGYPKEEAMRIAVDEISAFLLKHEMLVYLVVFDNASTRLGMGIYPELESYIDHNYIGDSFEKEYGDRFFGMTDIDEKSPLLMPAFLSNENVINRRAKFEKKASVLRSKIPNEDADSYLDKASNEPEVLECVVFDEDTESALDRRMQHLADSFQEYLFYLIDEKGMTNAEVYKRAIITKQTFSKMKKNPQYHPDKGTAMRLCVGCKLNLDETKDMLARAGYALSPSDKRDVIFSFFIENKIFDMIEIDIALEEYGLPCFIV